MRRTHWILAVAVTVVALSLNAVAQPPGGGQRGPGPGGMGPGPGGMGPGGGPGGGMGPGPGGMGMMMGGPGGMGGPAAMFQNPEFVKELGLTPEQTTQLQAVVRESGETMRSRFQEAMANRGPNAGPPSPEEMRRFSQFMESGMTEAQGKVDQVLKPEQRTKLGDMTFQLSGGLTSPMMGAMTLRTLELTNDQKEQLRKLTEERNEAMRNIGEIDWGDPAAREKFQAEMEARNAKFAEQVKGMLTPEQRAKAEKLTTESGALHKRLGIPTPEERQQQQRAQQQGRQQGGQAPPPAYQPGDRSWRPGGQSDAPPPRQQQQPRRFPSGGN